MESTLGPSSNKAIGDLIGIGPSALRTPKQWPGFMKALREHAFPPTNHMMKFDGSLIGRFPVGSPDEPTIVIARRTQHHYLHQYAEDLGLSVTFNTKVIEYYEHDDMAGAILEDGTKIKASAVIAADGVGSNSWRIISGQKDNPLSSGFAVYRATFPISYALEDPVVAKEYEGIEERISVDIGHNAHAVVAKSKTDISWMMTYMVRGLPYPLFIHTAHSTSTV